MIEERDEHLIKQNRRTQTATAYYRQSYGDVLALFGNTSQANAKCLIYNNA